MYHAEKLNHDRVIHDEEEILLTKDNQLNSIASNIELEQQNFFSEVISFFSIGFGISNLDVTNSDCNHKSFV